MEENQGENRDIIKRHFPKGDLEKGRKEVREHVVWLPGEESSYTESQRAKARQEHSRWTGGAE